MSSDLSPAELLAYQQRLYGDTAPRTVLAPTQQVQTVDPYAGQVRTLTTSTRAVTTEALTEEQLAILRAELGADIDVTEMQTRWERLGDVQLVVVEVVRERLAAFQAGPAQFSLAGVYSQNTAANIQALREQLARLQSEGPGGGLVEVKVTRTRPRRSR